MTRDRNDPCEYHQSHNHHPSLPAGSVFTTKEAHQLLFWNRLPRKIASMFLPLRWNLRHRFLHPPVLLRLSAALVVNALGGFSAKVGTSEEQYVVWCDWIALLDSSTGEPMPTTRALSRLSAQTVALVLASVRRTRFEEVVSRHLHL